ncbi:MAG: hypothetical protein AAFU85_15370 [Planctomycetota bacterium]
MSRQLIEEELASLGLAITPSQDHRERVLDVATSESRDRRTRLCWARSIIGLSLLLVCVPIIGRLRVDVPRRPGGRAVEAAALEHAIRTRTSYDWALVEVFARRTVVKPW